MYYTLHISRSIFVLLDKIIMKNIKEILGDVITKSQGYFKICPLSFTVQNLKFYLDAHLIP